MNKVIINDSEYFTNIKDEGLLQRCIDFFSDGCLSYAVSFFNKEKSIITKATIDNLRCLILRDFNFECCFIPKKAKNVKDAKELLESGLDLIELL